MVRTMTRSPWLGSVLIVSVCMLALSARSAAQSQATGKAKHETVSVTGCLQKGTEPGGFYITEGQKMWELSSSSVKLAEHVGHQVTVTGVAAHKSKAAEEKLGATEKTEASGRQYGDVTVKSLKMVSQTCSQ